MLSDLRNVFNNTIYQRQLLHILIVSLIFLDFANEVSAKKSKPKRCKLVTRGQLTAQIPLGQSTSPATFTSRRTASAIATATTTGTASSSTPTLPPFDYGNKKVVGVNLYVLSCATVPGLLLRLA
jgi:hypothetical protein